MVVLLEKELKELWEIIDSLNEITIKLKKYYLNKFENEYVDIELEKELLEQTKKPAN